MTISRCICVFPINHKTVRSGFVPILCLVSWFALVYAGCKIPVEPEVRGVNGFVVNRNNDLKHIQYEFDLQIFNPNAFALKILEYDLDVFVNGKLVGKAISDGKYRIAKLRDDNFHVRVESDLKKTFSTLLSVAFEFLGGEKHLQVGLSGVIRGKAHGVSKRIPVKTEFPVQVRD